MKRQALLAVAATLALLSADASFARSGGGMGSGGGTAGRGLYGLQAPGSPAQSRAQACDPANDRVQIKDQLRIRDPLTTQGPIRAHDQDRIHQPWAGDDAIEE